MSTLSYSIRQTVCVGILGLVFSCTTDPKAGQKVDDTVAVQTGNSPVLENVEGLLANLPRPSTIPNLIALTGAEYSSKLLNPVSNAEKVSSNSSKAAFSIGVFGADVAYMAAYDKGNEAVKTFIVGKKLADRIGVSSAFDASIIARVEKNLEKRDTLIAISDASLENSALLLRKNEQINDAVLLTAGAFVEGLHITCGLIHNYPNTGLPKIEQDKILVPLVKTVIKQEAALESLIELLNSLKASDEVITSLITKLEAAKAIYTKANWTQKMAENKGDMIPTEGDIKDLAIAISDIRNSMVQ